MIGEFIFGTVHGGRVAPPEGIRPEFAEAVQRLLRVRRLEEVRDLGPRLGMAPDEVLEFQHRIERRDAAGARRMLLEKGVLRPAPLPEVEAQARTATQRL